MGEYLQVPRDKWAPTDRYPAHDMMQLLLLAESVRMIGSDVAKIRLDTTQPRPATRHVSDIRVTATTVESRTTHSYWSDSQGVSVGQGAMATVGSGGQKRRRTAEAGDNVPNKRHSGNPFDGPSSSTRQKMNRRDESGDKPMDESTEKEITMEFQTQIDNQAQYESEVSHAEVKALEEVGREQVPLAVEVASKMQKEMFQADRWFILQAQKVN